MEQNDEMTVLRGRMNLFFLKNQLIRNFSHVVAEDLPDVVRSPLPDGGY